ncbi:MAG: hypothetical protein WCX74_03430 [Candidatus Paceibacterota bacterium]
MLKDAPKEMHPDRSLCPRCGKPLIRPLIKGERDEAPVCKCNY